MTLKDIEKYFACDPSTDTLIVYDPSIYTFINAVS